MKILGKQNLFLETSNWWERIRHLSCLSDTTGNHRIDEGMFLLIKISANKWGKSDGIKIAPV